MGTLRKKLNELARGGALNPSGQGHALASSEEMTCLAQSVTPLLQERQNAARRLPAPSAVLPLL